ncbi:MAG: zinc-binding dehydrogenase [Steroidobacteraceae bacterium]
MSQEFPFLLAQLDARDLETLAGMLQAGQIMPLVDRTYPLEQAAEAIRYLETGRARSKVVIAVDAPPDDAAAAAPLQRR